MNANNTGRCESVRPQRKVFLKIFYDAYYFLAKVQIRVH